MGVALLQEREEQVEHPVAFFSKKLTLAQRNYSVEEQESTLHPFEVYLPSHGTVIKIYSDDHPLQFLSNFKMMNQCLT